MPQITLTDPSGGFWTVGVDNAGDLNLTSTTSQPIVGLNNVLQSPNGTLYQLGVNSVGQLTTTQIGSGSTYSPQDAINLVQQFIHGLPVSGVQAQVCDLINSMIWVFYPWEWTVSTLTPITCVDGQQDYTIAAADIAAILRPTTLRIARTDVSPQEFRELGLLANMPIELTRKGGLETIRTAGYFGSSNIIRLQYPTGIASPQVLQIQGFYQARPTKIITSNMTTVFDFPDHYFNVFVEGVKWKLYQLSDDPRAGGAQYTKNGTKFIGYSGQLGVFFDAVLSMARTEDLKNGDEFMFPEDPLGVGRSYWPGLYGL